ACPKYHDLSFDFSTHHDLYIFISGGHTRRLSGRSGVSFTPSPQSLTYVSSWGFWRLLPCCTQKSIGYVK
ncbi:hypothetical protein, partial [Escherichia sp.]|nr:hypothetical protein [Escherichia coli]